MGTQIKYRYLSPLAGASLLVLMSGQASAYICTGIGNSLADPACDASEISAAIGTSFGGVLLAKDDDPFAAGPGLGGSTDYGTLEITQIGTGLTGEVKFTYTGAAPQVIIEKADNWYSVYDWATQVASLGGGEYSFIREFGNFDCNAQSINCGADTSHVSAYGVVPVPAAVWLFGSGLAGLIGLSRRTTKI